eukprot:TRINITY_DN17341_c0_g1_i2.p1 TRINITY_DN17341_c0_g1~~TRINITY_DN17341_c0_g1_i2.p1  ORF type:complete len:349 (+),score=91.12 TRINITY_DN17341_c0_g1_i2:598-1644(+)
MKLYGYGDFDVTLSLGCDEPRVEVLAADADGRLQPVGVSGASAGECIAVGAFSLLAMHPGLSDDLWGAAGPALSLQVVGWELLLRGGGAAAAREWLLALPDGLCLCPAALLVADGGLAFDCELGPAPSCRSTVPPGADPTPEGAAAAGYPGVAALMRACGTRPRGLQELGAAAQQPWLSRANHRCGGAAERLWEPRGGQLAAEFWSSKCRQAQMARDLAAAAPGEAATADGAAQLLLSSPRRVHRSTSMAIAADSAGRMVVVHRERWVSRCERRASGDAGGGCQVWRAVYSHALPWAAPAPVEALLRSQGGDALLGEPEGAGRAAEWAEWRDAPWEQDQRPAPEPACW